MSVVSTYSPRLHTTISYTSYTQHVELLLSCASLRSHILTLVVLPLGVLQPPASLHPVHALVLYSSTFRPFASSSPSSSFSSCLQSQTTAVASVKAPPFPCSGCKQKNFRGEEVQPNPIPELVDRRSPLLPLCRMELTPRIGHRLYCPGGRYIIRFPRR